MLRLEPDLWYDEDTLRARGIDARALAAARAAGQLRSKRVGRLRYYKGAWLKEWLEARGYAVVNTGLRRSALAGRGIERAWPGSRDSGTGYCSRASAAHSERTHCAHG